MNRFHLEVLTVSKDEKHSSVCRIYRFTDEKIRQVLNEEVNQFDTGSKVIVNVGTKGIDIILKKEEINGEKITVAYISNWVGITVPIIIESCRTTAFNKTEGITQKTTCIVPGKMTDFIEKCINIENRKFRDNL